ncbi:MAG: hypothetical protein QOH93_1385 [Chloroflexia bacterium]|nr:hypothetical protein [Chloroflexia bacterium]
MGEFAKQLMGRAISSTSGLNSFHFLTVRETDNANNRQFLEGIIKAPNNAYVRRTLPDGAAVERLIRDGDQYERGPQSTTWAPSKGDFPGTIESAPASQLPLALYILGLQNTPTLEGFEFTFAPITGTVASNLVQVVGSNSVAGSPPYQEIAFWIDENTGYIHKIIEVHNFGPALPPGQASFETVTRTTTLDRHNDLTLTLPVP